MATRKSSGNSRRILATVGVVGALGVVGGLGTYSAWSSQVTAGPQTVTAGTLNLTKEADTVTASITGVVPGDTIDRIITVKNSGTSNFGSIDFTSAGTGALASGLTLKVDACSVAWTGPTCSGSTVVLPEGSLSRSVNLTNLSALTSNTSSYLRVSVALPSNAPNELQGASATISYTVTGNQVAGTAK